MLSSRLAGIPTSSSIIDEAGLPQLSICGEQTAAAVTGSGGRLHFGMVAGIKSESPAGLPLDLVAQTMNELFGAPYLCAASLTTWWFWLARVL